MTDLAFTRLESNVKGAGTLELSKVMAVIGGNRSGKTSVVESIRAAILGKHPAGPHGVNLMELAPEGAEKLEIKLLGPAGMACLSVEAPGGKAKKPEHNCQGMLAEYSDAQLERMVPSVSMRSLLEMNDAKTREAVFKHFGDISEMPHPMALDEEQLAVWEEGARDVNPAGTMDVAAALSELSGWMRKKKLAFGREQKAVEKRIETAKSGGTLERASAGTELRREYEQALAKARAWENSGQARARLAEVIAQRDALVARKAQLEDAMPPAEEFNPEVRAKLAQLERDLEAARAARADVEHAYETSRSAHALYSKLWSAVDPSSGSTSNCPLCECETLTTQRLADIEKLVAQYETETARLRNESLPAAIFAVTNVEASIATLRSSVESAQNRYRNEVNNIESQILGLGHQIATFDTTLKDAPASYDGEPSSVIERQLDGLRDVQSQLTRLQEDTAALRGMEKSKGIAKLLEKEAANLLQDLLRKVKTTAETTVNRHMPENFTAVLDLEGTNCRWMVIGDDGRPHRRNVMAGSEEGALIVALGLAWTEGAPLRLLLLDDRDLYGFEPRNLRLFLDTLKRLTDEGTLTQVIVTSTRPHEVPDNWTKVWTSDAAALSAGATSGANGTASASAGATSGANGTASAVQPPVVQSLEMESTTPQPAPETNAPDRSGALGPFEPTLPAPPVSSITDVCGLI